MHLPRTTEFRITLYKSHHDGCTKLCILTGKVWRTDLAQICWEISPPQWSVMHLLLLHHLLPVNTTFPHVSFPPRLWNISESEKFSSDCRLFSSFQHPITRQNPYSKLIVQIHPPNQCYKSILQNLYSKSILTARPTVPSPKIATTDPASIFATFHTAPKPVNSENTFAFTKCRHQNCIPNHSHNSPWDSYCPWHLKNPAKPTLIEPKHPHSV